MNTLESYSVENPKNVTDTCARFVIDDTGSPFILSEIMSVGTRYVFTFWIKSEENSNVLTCGKTFATGTNWQKYSVVFSATSKDLNISFINVGTYYIYHPKLELGNLATDWSPAPEDTDADIVNSANDVRADMAEQNAATLESCSEMLSSELGYYVQLTEFGTFKESLSTELSVLDDEIEMKFTSVAGQVEEIDGEVQAKFREIEKHISFTDDGIAISDSDNIYDIQLDNVKGVTIRKNGEIRSQLIDDEFYTGNIHVETNERARFGNFAFVPRSDGSLSFLKVGD